MDSELKSPNHQKYNGRVLIVIILSSLFFFLIGISLGYKLNNKTPSANLSLSAQKDQEIEKLKKELNFAITDRAELMSEETAKYDKKLWPVYSNLFEGKEVVVSTYNYKGLEIVNKIIKIDENSSISLWEYSNKFLSNSQIKMAKIDASYGNNSAIYLEDIQKEWKTKYTNKNGITMYYVHTQSDGGEGTDGYIGDVSFQFYEEKYPNYRYTNSALVEVAVQLYPGLDKARSSLYNIANTIEYTRQP